MKNLSNKGAQAYTPLTLKLYDWWVLGISNRYAWRCPTEDVLLNHFKKHLGRKHLDIGVGTGFYLSQLDHARDITLMDLNTHSLDAARTRIGPQRIDSCVEHDVFNEFPQALHNSFDSVSLFYLLHCLPGLPEDKARAIKNAAAALNANGTLYGATILGDSAGHNGFGRKLMKVYNKKGIFSNRQDNALHLKQALEDCFEEVSVSTVGVVATFSASKKRV